MPVRTIIVNANPALEAAVRPFRNFLPGAELMGNATSAQRAPGAGQSLEPDLVLTDVETRMQQNRPCPTHA